MSCCETTLGDLLIITFQSHTVSVSVSPLNSHIFCKYPREINLPATFFCLFASLKFTIINLTSSKEAAVLTELQHPNLVCLVGVVTQEQPVCMLFEFLPQGDLHEFLIMRSPHSDVGCSSDEDGTVKSSLDHGDFLHMAIQVGSKNILVVGYKRSGRSTVASI